MGVFARRVAQCFQKVKFAPRTSFTPPTYHSLRAAAIKSAPGLFSFRQVIPHISRNFHKSHYRETWNRYMLSQPSMARHFPGMPTRAVTLIVALNILVYIAWQVGIAIRYENPELWNHLLRNYTLENFHSVIHDGNWFSVIGANFSHMGLLHIAFNTITLASFADIVLYSLGSVGKFYAFYLAACLSTSLFSMLYKEVHGKGRRVRSLGASGCVMGVLTFFALENPRATLSVMGIINAPAYILVTSIVLYSMWQSIVAGNTGTTDVAGHLGGSFAGILLWTLRRRSSGIKPLLTFLQKKRSSHPPRRRLTSKRAGSHPYRY